MRSATKVEGPLKGVPEEGAHALRRVPRRSSTHLITRGGGKPVRGGRGCRATIVAVIEESAAGYTEQGDREAALGGEILRTVVGSGVHGIAIAGTDDHDEMGVFVEPPHVCFGRSGQPQKMLIGSRSISARMSSMFRAGLIRS